MTPSAAPGRPAGPRPGTARALLPPIAVALAAAAGAAWLLAHDPHHPGQPLPGCPWRAVTGLDCPGCGGTRMAFDLLHGDLGGAFAHNPVLLALGVPVMALSYARWVRAATRGVRDPLVLGPRAVTAVLAVAVVWTVVRNVV